MIKIKDLPNILPIFPLSNFIIFPNTTVPLNIFEPRYVEMINDSMKLNKMIGLVQPKKNTAKSVSDLHDVGCLGKITSFRDIDGRFLIDLHGLCRFNIIKEIRNDKLYRTCEINFSGFETDLNLSKQKFKFSDIDSIFKDFKILFEKKGYTINWQSLEKQDLNEALNALAMASPFSLEEKQVLLESENLEIRKKKIIEILSTYNHDNYNNTTVQ